MESTWPPQIFSMSLSSIPWPSRGSFMVSKELLPPSVKPRSLVSCRVDGEERREEERRSPRCCHQTFFSHVFDGRWRSPSCGRPVTSKRDDAICNVATEWPWTHCSSGDVTERCPWWNLRTFHNHFNEIWHGEQKRRKMTKEQSKEEADPTDWYLFSSTFTTGCHFFCTRNPISIPHLSISTKALKRFLCSPSSHETSVDKYSLLLPFYWQQIDFI